MEISFLGHIVGRKDNWKSIKIPVSSLLATSINERKPGHLKNYMSCCLHHSLKGLYITVDHCHRSTNLKNSTEVVLTLGCKMERSWRWEKLSFWVMYTLRFAINLIYEWAQCHLHTLIFTWKHHALKLKEEETFFIFDDVREIGLSLFFNTVSRQGTQAIVNQWLIMCPLLLWKPYFWIISLEYGTNCYCLSKAGKSRACFSFPKLLAQTDCF